MISTRILADSINPIGTRLTSWLLTYPRFIHSEFMTHRAFSRNAASSRAIPFQKMRDKVCELIASPEYWGAEKPGMQSGGEVDDATESEAIGYWNQACSHSLTIASVLNHIGVHKSIANRIIEPYAHMTVLATATDHNNFFALRANPAAQPEFQVLAYRMLNDYLNSSPASLDWNEWHLPGLDQESADDYTIEEKLKITTALAARTTFSKFDDGIEHDKAFALHDRLAESGHWSPFEHSAKAQETMFELQWDSNFDTDGLWSGWLQYRKLFNNENQTQVNLLAINATKPDWITLVNEK